MKRTLGLALILAVAATADATVRVFVTTSSAGYGLNEPQNAFRPTFSTVDVANQNVNAYDFYHSNLGSNPDGNGFSVTNFPPQDTPSGTAASPVQIAVGDWAYI